MPPLVGLLVAGVVAAIAFLHARERRRGRMRVWHEAARAAGLQDVSAESDLFEMRLEARAGDLPIRLESYRRGRYETGTRIAVRCIPRHGAALSIRRENLGTALGKRLAVAEEIEIGDRTFDGECFVQGAAPLALAVLDRPTRRTLAGVLGGYLPVAGSEIEVRASFEDGVLSVDLRDYPFQQPGGRVGPALPTILDLARRLVPPADLAARLAENLRSEPEVGVRQQIVSTLAREFPDHPSTRPALLAQCQDPSQEIRLRAAVALGSEGREALLALLAQQDSDDTCRARAVTALGASLDRPLLEATLRQALAERALATACACIETMTRKPDDGSRALLFDALHDEDAPVRLAAIRGLGRVGTAESVAPLLELLSAGGEQRSAARQAIAEIQARLTGAAPGQLSLAGAEAGTLSLADGEPGRLSLAETEPSDPLREASDERLAPPAPRTPVRSHE